VTDTERRDLFLAAIAMAGALVYMRTNRPDSRPGMDWAGTVLASAGLFLIVFGFSHAELAGWTAALTIGSLVGGVILLTAFAFAESRVKHPLLPGQRRAEAQKQVKATMNPRSFLVLSSTRSPTSRHAGEANAGDNRSLSLTPEN
jgi:hypothetical protein